LAGPFSKRVCIDLYSAQGILPQLALIKRWLEVEIQAHSLGAVRFSVFSVIQMLLLCIDSRAMLLEIGPGMKIIVGHEVPFVSAIKMSGCVNFDQQQPQKSTELKKRKLFCKLFRSSAGSAS
jgi:hypothetical protein